MNTTTTPDVPFLVMQDVVRLHASRDYSFRVAAAPSERSEFVSLTAAGRRKEKWRRGPPRRSS